MDVLDRADLPFPHSLPEFQRLFPDDAACAAYLEKARWGDGFACPHCGTAGEPFHFENRPGVLRCRKCRQNTGLTVGTVMERSHTPLNVWFWAAYLVASQTPGMSAVQFQRQLGLSRYETAFQILHKLRSGMVRPNQDRIGGQPKNHVEVDETWVGGRTRGEGRGVHHKVLVSGAIEVRHRKPGTKLDNRKDGRYAGRVRLAVVLDRSAESLCGFVESTVAPGSLIVTDDWSGYGRPGFAEVDLGMAWIMGQRHKNLFAQALPGPDIVRHDGDATAITMLVAQPFENAFAGMALLLRLAFVIFQDLVDDAGIGIKLRTLRRLAPLISRRDRMFENLRHRLAVNTKPPRRLPLAQAITMTGQPYS